MEVAFRSSALRQNHRTWGITRRDLEFDNGDARSLSRPFILCSIRFLQVPRLLFTNKLAPSQAVSLELFCDQNLLRIGIGVFKVSCAVR